jgi:hypothetical protein
MASVPSSAPARGRHILSSRAIMADPLNVQVGGGLPGEDEISLVQIVDHVLNTGIVIQGSVVISLAGVDLVYLGLSAVLTSVETARKYLPSR